MFVDEVEIFIKAGNGGDGVVHFYSDAHRPKGGPDGGNGGNGGSVIIKAVNDIGRLRQFRHQKHYGAEDGHAGQGNNKTGHNGKDLLIEIPVGTTVHYDNGTSVELTTPGEEKILLKGGKGGWGNWHFRSATNQTPMEFTKGEPKPLRRFRLELKLIADVGLIGLPNAGKSSLLNELTQSNARVANYAFTTLEPNLGVAGGGAVIADIPGLIEGASQGKGLGIKFLRHIERTKVLVHCLSGESQDPAADYHTVRQELAGYSQSLSDKKEILVVTKSDLLNSEHKAKFEALKPAIFTSIIDESSLTELNRLISKSLS